MADGLPDDHHDSKSSSTGISAVSRNPPAVSQCGRAASDHLALGDTILNRSPFTAAVMRSRYASLADDIIGRYRYHPPVTARPPSAVPTPRIQPSASTTTTRRTARV